MKNWRRSSSSQNNLNHPFLEDVTGGLYITVRVVPRASKNELVLERERLKAKLTSPPVDGKANKALIALFAKLFKFKKASIEITSGLKSRDKRLFIKGIDRKGFIECLAQKATVALV